MVQNKEKKLLYFDYYQKIAEKYNGEPIYHYIFKDVRTGDIVTLGACYYNVELSKVFGFTYYENIEDANYDFDILWNITYDNINPISINFNEVQMQYYALLNKGINVNEINLAMKNEYNCKSKIK